MTGNEIKLLETVPDFSSWDTALLWLEQGRKQVSNYIPKNVSSNEMVSMDWSDVEQKSQSPLGMYSVENWRKFVLATFLADLVSYENPVDQVSFDRLLFVMHAFPKGFRTWWVKLSDGSWWPVGYTGWYPMLQTMYELFEKKPGALKNRIVVPDVGGDRSGYLYLFNFSVAPGWKKTLLAKNLMKTYVQDIIEQKALGLACITVSEDGMRLAKRLGMECSGQLTIDGSVEGIYVS